MKTKYLLYILFLLAFTGCKKSSEIDPRDQYVGTYNITVNSLSGYTNVGIPVTSYVDNDVLVVTKDSNPTDLIFSFSKGRLTARLSNGNSFTILPASLINTSSGGKEYQTNYDGDGAFSENYVTCYIAWNSTLSGNTTKSVNTIKGAKK